VQLRDNLRDSFEGASMSSQGGPVRSLNASTIPAWPTGSSCRGTGGTTTATVTGTLLGTGPSPCWDGSGINVYKASVPLTVATGNGSYKVTIKPTAVGLTDGSDPWVRSGVFPAWEGTSLVIVGSGSGIVSIYDAGFAGTTFVGSLSYTLLLPANASGTLTLWDNIGADGQFGPRGRSANSASDEATSINGVAVAGPGGLNNDSDWNGSSGFPLPQLWDDTGHDITSATPAGTDTLAVTITTSPGPSLDCLTTVANVTELH
jgi:hypothetical protein